jgi:hypothetical protein
MEVQQQKNTGPVVRVAPAALSHITISREGAHDRASHHVLSQKSARFGSQDTFKGIPQWPKNFPPSLCPLKLQLHLLLPPPLRTKLPHMNIWGTQACSTHSRSLNNSKKMTQEKKELSSVDLTKRNTEKRFESWSLCLTLSSCDVNFWKERASGELVLMGKRTRFSIHQVCPWWRGGPWTNNAAECGANTVYTYM